MNFGFKEWAKEYEDRIEYAIIKSGLDVKYVGRKRGPHAVSFMIELAKVPDKRVIKRLYDLEQSLSVVLDNQPVTIRPVSRRSWFAIQVESPLPRTPTAEELLPHGSKFEIAVGYDVERKPVMVDFDYAPVFAWIGPMRKGKSESVRTSLSIILSRAPIDRAKAYVFARKPDEWDKWRTIQHVEGVVGPDEAGRWLDHLAYKVFNQRNKDRVEWPRIFIVLDDLAGLLRYDSSIEKPVTDLVLNGPAKGFRVWLTTQEGGTKQGMAGLDSVISNRLVYRPPTGGASYRAGGVKGLDLTKLSANRGDAFAILDGRVERCATGWKWEEIVYGLPREQLALDVPEGFKVVEPHASQVGVRLTGASHPSQGESLGVRGGIEFSPMNEATHRSRGVMGVSAGVSNTPPELPTVPEILENREPDCKERAAIIAYILAMYEYEGDWPSQSHLIREVYAGVRTKTRNDACRAMLVAAQREVGQEFGNEPTQAAPPMPTEEEEIIEMIRSGAEVRLAK